MKSLREWSVAKGLAFTVDSFPDASTRGHPMCEALHALKQANAFEGDRPLGVPDVDEELTDGLKALESVNCAMCVERRDGLTFWTFTEKGSSSFRVGIRLCNPVSVCEPRADVQPKDMTTWELVKALQGQGWTATVSDQNAKVELEHLNLFKMI